ncbi:general transcription factor 3C polypeptide 1-like isoform X2 [Patiria miniata]|uniref:Uncharacterized protein n=1 Tax=Patiria miniata TaxID=46514 RepID=A0A913ZTD8_PATMI|nr:general transcription factor 3C polypeptide 1-like isoform X2 [Patiria miniata]
MSYLHEICLDEIALEGLDGITLACLWCRLDQRLPKFPLALDPKAKQFLWKGILASKDVAFFSLPEPRKLPTFPHEYMTTDEPTGIVFLKEEVQRKEYPACIINSFENDGIQGSCATFKERVDISDEVRGHDGGKVMTLEEVQKRWGDSLVIVASQELRMSALVGPHGDPSLELSGLRYSFLEFVGRQRHFGAQQVDFARLFKLTLTSLHSLRKDLSSNQLLDKRTCLCRTAKHLKNSIFLMLLRFGPLAKHSNMSHHGMLSTNLIQILEKQPKRTADFKFLFAELAKKLPSWTLWHL